MNSKELTRLVTAKGIVKKAEDEIKRVTLRLASATLIVTELIELEADTDEIEDAKLEVQYLTERLKIRTAELISGITQLEIAITEYNSRK